MNIGKRLTDKVAIVTGGASGIGAETVRTFAAHGAIVVAADVQNELGSQLVNEVNEAGGKAIYRNLDVTDEAAWKELVDETVSIYEKLNILGNIAGVSGRDPDMKIQTTVTPGPTIESTSSDVWNRIMDVNVKGVYLGTKLCIPAMRPASLQRHPKRHPSDIDLLRPRSPVWRMKGLQRHQRQLAYGSNDSHRESWSMNYHQPLAT